MADTYNYLTSTGVIVPDTATILADVQGEFRTAFGQDLQVTPDTPQGVLITAETAARSMVAANNAELANQINPNEAGGVFLDALCALMFLQREAATHGIIPNAVLTGQASTIVPAGSLARDNAGELWATVGNVQLSALGTATVSFRALNVGPIDVGPGQLVTVVDNVLGWEGVNNPNAAIPGTFQQSDESLRMLRNLTLARQGISTVEAQMSGLYDTEGVKSLQYRENISDSVQVIDGITMSPHSIWACVFGGTDIAVATSLLTNKTDGAGWNGAVDVPIVEPYSGQTYHVLFDRPAAVAVLARITVRRGTSVVDPAIAIPQAVVDYANGNIPGEQGFTVGANVSPFELAGAINYFYPELFVAKVELSKASPVSWAVAEIDIAIDELATITQGSVQVIVQ